MKLLISGIGPVGGFGAGLEALHHALATATPPAGYTADTAPLENYLHRRATRRIDHFSQLGLLAAHLALEDAGLLGGDLSNLGLVVVSGYGPLRTTFAFLDSVLDDGDCLASPTHFSNSVHNAAAAHISIQLGMSGPNLSLSQFELSVAAGLQVAQCWLKEGRVDSVLFGAIDEACPVVDYCYRRYFGDTRHPISPWDLSRQTAQPGEGACFLVLQHEKVATKAYASLAGVDMATRLARFSPAATEPWILGCDGHSACGPLYSHALPANTEVACYTPLYGSLPVGSGFDVAIASLALLQGALFPCPPLKPESPWTPAQTLTSRMHCLKLAADGSWGRITLETA
ncbi:MAG: hypothetical protein Tsb0017_07450 [Geothermobacteraceae bacterium]